MLLLNDRTALPDRPYLCMPLQLRPESADVWMNFASVLADLRRLDDASHAYRRATAAYVADGTDGLRAIAKHFPSAAKSLKRAEDAPLAASLRRIAAGAASGDSVLKLSLSLKDHPDGVCGATCSQLADEDTAGGAEGGGSRPCALRWEQRCGGDGGSKPPEGFEPSVAIAELCGRSCAWDALELRGGGQDAGKMERSKIAKP